VTLGDLPAVERDRFGVLPEADEGEAEVGLAPLLRVAELYERPPDAMNPERTDDRVDEGAPDEVAG
jgi:hypothetical protein